MSPSRCNGSRQCPDLDGGFKWRKQLLRSLQSRLDLVQITGEGECPGFLNGQPWMVF